MPSLQKTTQNIFSKILLSIIIFILATNSSLAVFNDVKDELTPEIIEWLRENNIGENNENFYPKRPITIAEFLSMGFVAAGVKNISNGASRFEDVQPNDWFNPFVVEAEKLGMLNDFRGSKLLPKRPVNRGEAIKLGLELFGIGVPLVLPEEKFNFQDVRKTHRLARYIFRAVKIGIINPESDHSFGITRRISRADAAKLFYNLTNFKTEDNTTIIIQNGVSQIPNWQLFETVWRETQNKFLFPEKIQKNKMMYSAVQGVVDALDDPYSEFYTPEQTKVETSNLSGEIEGIGVYIELDKKERGLLIVAPIFNSPADRAGLRTGDIITTVNGKSLAKLPLEEAANLTKGPTASTGIYTILREEQSFKVEIIREKIKIDPISLELKNNIAIVDINQFTATLPEDFGKIAEQIRTQHPRGIVLDLRNNGGGLITAAIDLLGYFLPENSIIAKQEFRTSMEKNNIDYRTKREPAFHGMRTIVLVNKGSASASEIVAAALQDHNVASVAGEQTFGKGTVQEISFFKNGAALKLTIAHWLSPNKRAIQDIGVTPDFDAVDNPETVVDEALERVLEMF
jgi:carboxyl-terminal processing protease